MPILNRRYNYSKIYRPSGTRFTTAKSEFVRPWSDKFKYEQYAVSAAGTLAILAFREEFGEPDWDRVVIEIVCDSFGAHATLFEIVDNDD